MNFKFVFGLLLLQYFILSNPLSSFYYSGIRFPGLLSRLFSFALSDLKLLIYPVGSWWLPICEVKNWILKFESGLSTMFLQRQNLKRNWLRYIFENPKSLVKLKERPWWTPETFRLSDKMWLLIKKISNHLVACRALLVKIYWLKSTVRTATKK